MSDSRSGSGRRSEWRSDRCVPVPSEDGKADLVGEERTDTVGADQADRATDKADEHAVGVDSADKAG